MEETKTGKNSPFKMIFSEKIIGATVKLAFAWLSLCVIYYGIMFELPTILQIVYKQEHDGEGQRIQTKDEIFFVLIMAAIAELPAGTN